VPAGHGDRRTLEHSSRHPLRRRHRARPSGSSVGPPMPAEPPSTVKVPGLPSTLPREASSTSSPHFGRSARATCRPCRGCLAQVKLQSNLAGSTS
jgi:hypothetical protein